MHLSFIFERIISSKRSDYSLLWLFPFPFYLSSDVKSTQHRIFSLSISFCLLKISYDVTFERFNSISFVLLHSLTFLSILKFYVLSRWKLVQGEVGGNHRYLLRSSCTYDLRPDYRWPCVMHKSMKAFVCWLGNRFCYFWAEYQTSRAAPCNLTNFHTILSPLFPFSVQRTIIYISIRFRLHNDTRNLFSVTFHELIS